MKTEDKLLNVTMPLDMLWIFVNIGCPIAPTIWVVSSLFYYMLYCFDDVERNKEWHAYLVFPLSVTVMTHYSKGKTVSKQQEKIKGKKHGLCNRTACQSPKNVVWYNFGTYAYYCPECAKLINKANKGIVDYDLCYEEI